MTNNIGTSSHFMSEVIKDPQEEAQPEQQTVLRLFSFLKSKSMLILAGLGVATADGVVFPFAGIYIAKVLAAQLLYHSDPDRYASEINTYCLTIFIAALVALVVNTLQYIVFVSLGMRMATQIRS